MDLKVQCSINYVIIKELQYVLLNQKIIIKYLVAILQIAGMRIINGKNLMKHFYFLLHIKLNYLFFKTFNMLNKVLKIMDLYLGLVEKY
jgi:hypothetical protein